MRDESPLTWHGFNLSRKEYLHVLLAVAQGELLIHGLSNRRLRAALSGNTDGPIARIIQRPRVHATKGG